jgi:hypothetical protein
MSVLAKLVREPLVHFVLIGAAVFGLYALIGGEEPRDKILVTEGRMQQLAEVFTKTWQRPPTTEELRGLVESYVKEEIYYREALELGLDRDDTLIRRRMQQKLEFLTEPAEELLRADDTTLEAYRHANKAAFRVEPRVAFEQVLFKPRKSALERSKRALETLQAAEPGDIPSGVGDPTLLPQSTSLSPLGVIAQSFGAAFAANLSDLREHEWAGPIESPYGLHLVRVTARVEGHDPDLAEIRDAVEQKWRDAKRDAFQKQAYDALRAKYDVVLPPAETGTSDKAEAAP